MATVHPKEDFSAEDASNQLREAMQGLGTNEDEIIDALTSHNCEQRQEIATTFKTMFGKDLIDDLKSELGGNLEDVVMAVMEPIRHYDAKELNKAMKGAGTDESTIVEILASRTTEEIEEIKTIYQEEFENSLEDDLESDTSGYFKRFLVSMVAGGREEGDDVDEDKAREDAQTIVDAGPDQWGTDEAAINSVLCLRSMAQLRATWVAYAELKGEDLLEVLKSETSGSVQEGYTSIVKYALNPPEFFAERLHDAMSGAGTDDNNLIRIIVSRSEVDMHFIKLAFYKLYEKSLREWIIDDCGGDYKKMLLRLIAAPDDE